MMRFSKNLLAEPVCLYCFFTPCLLELGAKAVPFLELQGGVQQSMLNGDFVVWHGQSARFLISLIAPPLEGGALAPGFALVK